ncbi:hypothetical protein RUND412_000881 [Rhizina undulata]
MKDALLPHQILNEVAFMQFIALNIPSIPVAKVFAFNAGTSLVGMPLIAEEYVEAYRANSTQRIATTLGLTIQSRIMSSPAMTRRSTTTLMLRNQTSKVIFEKTSLSNFVQTLKETRQSLLDNDSNFLPAEPFVLNHGDFHGRNILMNGTNVAAVIDWEFAGAYPLSELLGDEGVDIVECVDAPSMKENSKWCDRILDLVKEAVSNRGWNEKDIKLLFEGKNEVLQRARCEMFPEDL